MNARGEVLLKAIRLVLFGFAMCSVPDFAFAQVCASSETIQQISEQIKCGDLFSCSSDEQQFRNELRTLRQMRDQASSGNSQTLENFNVFLKWYEELGNQVIPLAEEEDFFRFMPNVYAGNGEDPSRCFGTIYFEHGGQFLQYIWFRELQFVLMHKANTKFTFIAAIWEKLVAGDKEFPGYLQRMLRQTEETIPRGMSLIYDIRDPQHARYTISMGLSRNEYPEFDSASGAIIDYFAKASNSHTIFPAPF